LGQLGEHELLAVKNKSIVQVRQTKSENPLQLRHELKHPLHLYTKSQVIQFELLGPLQVKQEIL